MGSEGSGVDPHTLLLGVVGIQNRLQRLDHGSSSSDFYLEKAFSEGPL